MFANQNKAFMMNLMDITLLLLQVGKIYSSKRFNITNRELSPMFHLSLAKISNLPVACISVCPLWLFYFSEGNLGDTNVT